MVTSVVAILFSIIIGYVIEKKPGNPGGGFACSVSADSNGADGPHRIIATVAMVYGLLCSILFIVIIEV